MPRQHAVTLQLGLEGSVPLEQVQGGGIKEHRGYLGVITITSIACHDHTAHTCQNLSGIAAVGRISGPNQFDRSPRSCDACGPIDSFPPFSPFTPFVRVAARRSA